MSSTRPSLSLQSALADRKVVVVCGTGGVGKTTISASLALAAARTGRRVLVMTIDPARRLASSLGIDEQLGEETPISLAALTGAEKELPEGAALHAMMLDAKSTWDGVVRRFAPNAQSRDRILANRYYQRAAGSLAGSQEYMAMEKLLEVVRSERYDLVVLDTPPTRNALDFLEAPQRMMGILQDSIIKWIAPRSGGFSAARAGALLFGRGQQAMFSVFERFLGSDVLSGISEFISSFSGLLDGMRERASEVMKLLASTDTAFVLVASPSRISLDEALYFHDRLGEGGISVRALVVNRTQPVEDGLTEQAPSSPFEAGFAPSRASGHQALLEALWKSYQSALRQRQLDERSINELHLHCGTELPLARIPRLQGEVHDLQALSTLAGLLNQS
jgi:anion-transporting  ArsA/GET3 family ATPase